MFKITKTKLAAFSGLLVLASQLYFGNIPLLSSRLIQKETQVLGSTEASLSEERTSQPFSVFRRPIEGKTSPPPLIEGTGAIAIDLSDDSVIYEKNSHKRLPAASTIKVMTSFVAIENMDIEEIVTVSKEAASVEPDSMGLFPGEKLTLKQLLQGLLLVSANDSAEAIAEGVSGSRAGFVSLMNKKAKALGMNDSLFINPSGLEGDGIHYSSAYDLALLSKYALQKPIFREIVAKKEILIPYTVNEKENHKNFYLANSSPLIDYPGYRGIKPGFTPEAKKCLITLVEMEGKEVLVVVLGSNDRKGDTERLLEYVRRGR